LQIAHSFIGHGTMPFISAPRQAAQT